jgi:hypothetical protein
MMLHQIAKDKRPICVAFVYGRRTRTQEALNTALWPQLQYQAESAKIEARLSDEAAQTINTLHAIATRCVTSAAGMNQSCLLSAFYLIRRVLSSRRTNRKG